jgi:creatinine amidohydrolase/Fe(II)-dependent formamide hydrolase-like protein/ribosomal protein S18 acetylase RimI-like enzyme
VIDGHNTTEEWQAHSGDICVLPVGAFEQHAAHLPLDTDNIMAEFYARLIAEDLDAALLPALRFATSLEHTGFRGSISLRPETLMQVIRDLADVIEGQGFRILIVVNNHGGNHCLVPVIRDINRADRPLKILMMGHPGGFAGPGAADGRERGLDIHAGERETSIMLAVRPDLVRSAQAIESSVARTAPDEAEDHPLRQADLTTFGIGHFNPKGAIGDPRLASAEKGQAALDSIRANMLSHIRDRIRRLRAQPRYAGAGGIALRQMQVRDIEAGMRLVQIAGWNQTQEDWEFFLRLNPLGCTVAVQNGQVIGTITTIHYGDALSWISMLLVDPGYREMGIGSRLMEHAVASLRGRATVRLDATPLGEAIYRRLGFQPERNLSRLVHPSAPSPTHEQLGHGPEGVRTLSSDLLSEAERLDWGALGGDRSALLRDLRQRAPDMAWADVQDGRLTGFCLGRHGSRYHQVGPIVAETVETAKALCQACLASLRGRPAVLDVPTSQEGFIAWLQSLGFVEQRTLTRMRLGEAVRSEHPTLIYAIAGPELG